jgi:uncharacterized protein
MRGFRSYAGALLTGIAVLASCAPQTPESPLSEPSEAISAREASGQSLSAVRADDSAKALNSAAAQDGFDSGRVPSALRFGQPVDERTAQEALPKSPDGQWAVLETTRIGEDLERGVFTASHSSRVRALAGRTLSISGYVMPLETTPTFQRFLLTRYTPVCNFCPPGAPNEVIEVVAATHLAPTQALIRVRGAFSLANNSEQGLFFRIDNAQIEDVRP